MGSSSRQRSTSATRRRAQRRRQFSTADEEGDETTTTTIHGLSSVLIWILATSSLIVVITPPSTNHPRSTSYDPITTAEKLSLDDISSTLKMNGQLDNNQGQYDQGNMFNMKSDYPMFNRPMGLRYRNDEPLMRMRMQQQPVVSVRPILTEHPRTPFGLPSTSNHHATTSNGYGYNSPTLEDMDLIDVLWRSDIAGEKGTPTVEPAEQYERDLMTLTEKSSAGPLNAEERDAYEGLSLNLYQGFFDVQYQKAHPEQVKLHTPEQHSSHDESENGYPTDNDLEELLKDVSREESELNKVFENTNPVRNNVSLSEGIVYTQANLTEMQELQDSCNQVNLTASSVVSSSQAVSLFNDTDAQTQEQWQDAEMGPADLFQPSNYVYVGMQNDTPQAIVSNGQVGYDHAYSASVQAPLSPLNLARSTNGRQQQTQTSPGSATVTATATHSLFEPHYMPRNSFSDCTTDSSSPCSRLSSESPRYNSESSSGQHESRFYGKLIPSRGSRFERPSPSRSPHSSIKINRVMNAGTRKRGRQSKDEQLASDHALPVTAHQISEMSLSELQQVLKQDDLSEYQRQLIRKIRRRGKNKVAARTCRQRRTDRHDKVSSMAHYI